MKTVAREVYHCDYCKQYRLRKWAMEQHEYHCLRNPARVCKICQCGPTDNDPSWVRAENESASDFLARIWIVQVECPLCMLAILIQSNTTGVEADWDYETEYKIYREEQIADRGYY